LVIAARAVPEPLLLLRLLLGRSVLEPAGPKSHAAAEYAAALVVV